jgi:hypothetical protein
MHVLMCVCVQDPRVLDGRLARGRIHQQSITKRECVVLCCCSAVVVVVCCGVVVVVVLWCVVLWYGLYVMRCDEV